MRGLRDLISCRWTARRIQRYLDADPAAPLDPGEIARLEVHLDECQRCQGMRDQYRGLSRLLARLALATQPDPRSVDRMHQQADAIKEGRSS